MILGGTKVILLKFADYEKRNLETIPNGLDCKHTQIYSLNKAMFLLSWTFRRPIFEKKL